MKRTITRGRNLINQKTKRVINMGKHVDKIDTKIVAEALGASIVCVMCKEHSPASDGLPWHNGKCRDATGQVFWHSDGKPAKGATEVNWQTKYETLLNLITCLEYKTYRIIKVKQEWFIAHGYTLNYYLRESGEFGANLWSGEGEDRKIQDDNKTRMFSTIEEALSAVDEYLLKHSK